MYLKIAQIITAYRRLCFFSTATLEVLERGGRLQYLRFPNRKKTLSKTINIDLNNEVPAKKQLLARSN